MRKTTVCFSIFFGFTFLGQLQAAPLVELIDLKWCSSIATSDDQEKNREPVRVYQNGTIFKGSRLYLWMKVKGDQEALDLLRKGKKIGIIQKWKYQYYGTQTDPIDVSIGTKKLSTEVINKLQQEINQRGYFDWRTWGTKDNLKAEKYTVEFVDDFYDPLNCAQSLSCTMSIKIR